MKVIDEVEHEDGSATYTFEMTEEERRICVGEGIKWMLVAGITGATIDKVFQDYVADEALKELARQAQEMENENTD